VDHHYGQRQPCPERYKFVTGSNNDDFVGTVKHIHVDCYVLESGPTWHALILDETGTVDGSYVGLDNTDDAERVMCDPESFEPVSVSIDGPTQIPPSAAEGCGYTAYSSGGAELNHYEWKWDGNVVGEDYSEWVPWGGSVDRWSFTNG